MEIIKFLSNINWDDPKKVETKEQELPLSVFKKQNLVSRSNFPLNRGTVVEIEIVCLENGKRVKKYLDRKPLEQPVLASLVNTSASRAVLVPTSQLRDKEGVLSEDDTIETTETAAEVLRKEEKRLASEVLEREGFIEEAQSGEIQSLRLIVGVI
jgi:hypothetical protein